MKSVFRNILVVFTLLSLLVGVGFSQQFNFYNPQARDSYSVGVYYAPNYAYGFTPFIPPLKVTTGTTASGAGTLTLAYGSVVMPDGRKFYPFSPFNTTQSPITVDIGANLETVTPSAVSCSTPDIINTCQITATFSYAHGAGTIVQSGDMGIQEAINDAAYLGGGMVFWALDPGPVTLNTGGLNTSLGSINIPTRSVVVGATARVETTIGTCAGGWSLGYSTGTEFSAANTTLVAGTTTDSSTLVPMVAFNAAATVPIAHCTTSNASAGVIHARIWGYKYVAPMF